MPSESETPRFQKILEAAFASVTSDACVKVFCTQYGDQYAVEFSTYAHRAQVSLTPIAASVTADDSVEFIALTRILDPLEAFGRRTDWRIIDGCDKGLHGADVRSGLPADIAKAVVDKVAAYVSERWPNDVVHAEELELPAPVTSF